MTKQKHTRDELLAEKARLLAKRNSIVSQLEMAVAKKRADGTHADPIWWANAQGALRAVGREIQVNDHKLSKFKGIVRQQNDVTQDLLLVLKECEEFVECVEGRSRLWQNIRDAIQKAEPGRKSEFDKACETVAP